MLAYIKGILPRLQKYSKHLDKTENFVGKEWLLIDDKGNNHSYEFLRDGRLIMTLVTNSGTSQETQVGSWELLPTERLLITRQQGQLTLKQGFIGDGLLILQESGTTNIPFNCYDPKVIPDGDVEAYLKKYIEVKEAAQITSTTEVNEDGNRVYRNPDGSLYNGELRSTHDETVTIEIENGLEIGRYCIMLYDTDKGAIKIKVSMPSSYYARLPGSGDEVFTTEGITAPDGIYKIAANNEGFETITVANGVIIKIADNTRKVIINMIIVSVAFMLIIAILIAGKSCN